MKIGHSENNSLNKRKVLITVLLTAVLCLVFTFAILIPLIQREKEAQASLAQYELESRAQAESVRQAEKESRAQAEAESKAQAEREAKEKAKKEAREKEEAASRAEEEARENALKAAYGEAVRLLEEGNPEKAKAAFLELGDYGDAAQRAAECDERIAQLEKEALEAWLQQRREELREAKVGDTVLLGNWTVSQADGDGAEAEPITWLVVDRQGERLLLLSTKILETTSYLKLDSLLCTFGRQAFSDADRVLIEEVSVMGSVRKNTAETEYTSEYTFQPALVRSKVFLLSAQELKDCCEKAGTDLLSKLEDPETALVEEWWLRQNSAMGAYADYAFVSDKETCIWLASKSYQITTNPVNVRGRQVNRVIGIYDMKKGFRPAIWLDLSEPELSETASVESQGKKLIGEIYIAEGNSFDDAAEVARRIYALKAKYPEGTRWVKIDDPEYDETKHFYQLKTQEALTVGGLSVKYADDETILYTTHEHAYFRGAACWGFSQLLSDGAFAGLEVHPNWFDWGEYRSDWRIGWHEGVPFDSLRPGDFILYSNRALGYDTDEGHVVTVIEKHDDYLVIGEGNYNRSVHWGRHFSREEYELAADEVFSRYPSFTLQPQDVTVRAGEEALFFAVPDQLVESFTWLVSSDGGETWYRLNETADVWIFGGILRFTASADMDGWLFRCVTTYQGGWYLYSDTAVLRIEE